MPGIMIRTFFLLLSLLFIIYQYLHLNLMRNTHIYDHLTPFLQYPEVIYRNNGKEL